MSKALLSLAFFVGLMLILRGLLEFVTWIRNRKDTKDNQETSQEE